MPISLGLQAIEALESPCEVETYIVKLEGERRAEVSNALKESCRWLHKTRIHARFAVQV